ncbi:MAG: hypothetical protein M3N32_07730, partial [Actinomycetota bacterium]|nr:hypothetical protein [Actinomycetota bacterium]
VTDAATAKPTGTTGTYEWVLPAQTNLDRLRLDWTGTIGGLAQTVTTWAEIVGGVYVTLAEIRAQPNLSNTTTFTSAELEAARRWFEDTFERYCGEAFVPRYASELVRGQGGPLLLLKWHSPRLLRGVLEDGAAQTVTDWELLPYGALERPSGAFGTSHSYRIRYEHGRDATPEDIREACLIAVRSKLLTDQSGTRSRELSIRNEYGNIAISQPSPPTPFGASGLKSPGRPFGIPEVDEVANAYWHSTVAIG